MNCDLGELLREGIDRATEGEHLRPGLATRARQRHRRRALAVRSAAVTGTAGTAAVALVAATLSGNSGPRGGALTVQTTAYVVSRTEQALAAARHNLIEQVTYTAPRGDRHSLGYLARTRPSRQVGGPQFFTSVTLAQIRDWRYHGWVRVQGFTASGRLAANIGPRTAPPPDASGPPSQLVVVDPNAGKWFHPLGSPERLRLDLPVCRTLEDWETLASEVRTADQALTLIKKALSCGMFRVGGHQKVDGTDAIRLVATRKLMADRAGPSPGLWVDATTFLPVRLLFSPRTGATDDFTWLPPTPANLAMLRVKVPAGSKEVQVSTAFEIWAKGLAS